MRHRSISIWLLVLILLGVLLFRFSKRQRSKDGIAGLPSREETKPRSQGTTTVAAPTSPPQPPAAGEMQRDGTMRRLDLALTALRRTGNAQDARQVLQELRAYLTTLPPEVAASVMADFLKDPSRDVATPLSFSVGKAGMLDGHPSLRVALLDWLGQIHPDEAGLVAAAILATPTQPDEWAVCLRNYAHAYPSSASREFLRTKTEELIRHPDWRENPSVGYLEAFDVFVHTHATESSPLLGELVADQTAQGKALAHAAYLTLDRLTFLEPVAMMEQFTSQKELTKVRGPMVANMFARADLRDTEQRRLVRSYLLDPARSSDELTAFFGVYPNANFAISKNLLSQTRTPTGRELAAHDVAALAIVKTWLEDRAFAPMKPYLTNMHDRLATFVSQVAR